jgi:16S rRNA processing protein RimM
LEGLEVVDQQQGVLGPVVGMFSTAAHDILEVEGPSGEILIPAIEPFLIKVDRKAGQLQVNLPDGLVPEADQ